MNPLTNMKNVTKLSEQELRNNSKSSWHDQYRDSAWIFIGGLPYDLTEGDIICIFSQYGEIVNINLIRDKDTGKSKGFCFLCYEDQRSTILSVDNLNGIKVLNRILRVDHVSEYKVPKEGKNTGEETKKLYNEGCAPKAIVPIAKNPLIVENLEYRRETLADQIQADIRLPARLPIRVEVKKEIDVEQQVEVKIEPSMREEKSKEASESRVNEASGRKKKKKKKSHSYSTESDSDDISTNSEKRHRSRSRSGERKKNPSDSDRKHLKLLNLKTKHRSRARSSERQNKKSGYEDNGLKDYREKTSNYDKYKYQSYRRRSRS